MVVNVCCKTLQRVYIGAKITLHTFRCVKLRRMYLSLEQKNVTFDQISNYLNVWKLKQSQNCTRAAVNIP